MNEYFMLEWKSQGEEAGGGAIHLFEILCVINSDKFFQLVLQPKFKVMFEKKPKNKTRFP